MKPFKHKDVMTVRRIFTERMYIIPRAREFPVQHREVLP